jgi:plastocyanin
MNRLSALALVSACAIGAGIPQAARGAPKTIAIERFAFAPAEVRVSAGDTVTWINRDAFVHTITADSAAWSSPELLEGQQYVFVAGKSGRFAYHCAAHPVMRGVLIVQQ